MNQFNSFFYPQSMIKGASPFATAGSSLASRATSSSLLSNIGRNKITLSGILNGAQKTIGTVNQVVPIYNQIKPMFQNSKVIFNVFKGLKGNSKFQRKNHTTQFHNTSMVEVSPLEEIKSTIIKEEKKIDGNSPSKPFFI